jgi:hypothetical protein
MNIEKLFVYFQLVQRIVGEARHDMGSSNFMTKSSLLRSSLVSEVMHKLEPLVVDVSSWKE